MRSLKCWLCLFLLVAAFGVAAVVLSSCGAAVATVSNTGGEPVTQSADKFEAVEAKATLSAEVQQADTMVRVNVRQIEALEWTTPNGLPPQADDDPILNEQLAPVTLVVLSSCKGKDVLTVYIGGAPNSKRYGGHPDFPKIGQNII